MRLRAGGTENATVQFSQPCRCGASSVQVHSIRRVSVGSGGGRVPLGPGRVPPTQFLKLERLHLTSCVRLQVWPDEVTLTFGGAQARSRRRQGEAGGPGSPRPRPDPSHTHSSPPAPHILTCALAAHADQGACCSLCDGGGQGAVPHPHGGCWAAFCNRGAALSRKKLRVFACLRVVVSAWSDFKVEYVVETGQTPTSVAPL